MSDAGEGDSEVVSKEVAVGRTSEVFRAVAPHPSGRRAAARGGVSRVDGRHSGAPPEAIGNPRHRVPTSTLQVCAPIDYFFSGVLVVTAK